MCLYPKFGLNPKYRRNKKNGGIVPECKDERLRYVPYKCGKCWECRKEKARNWRIRLSEEARKNFGYFTTLTFSDKSFGEIMGNLPIEGNENICATIALRRCLERIRKITGKSVKHFFVTELGEKKGRIHLHGIIYGQTSAALFKKCWKYGTCFIGSTCNEASINYITKYMLKFDEKHPKYTQIVLASKGIGAGWEKRWDAQQEKRKVLSGSGNPVMYRFRNGTMVPAPKYYKDKLLNDDEKDIAWLGILDKGIMYIGGEECPADDLEMQDSLRQFYQERAKKCHKDNPRDWDKQKYFRKLEKQRKAVRLRAQLADTAKRNSLKAVTGKSFYDGQNYEEWKNQIKKCERERRDIVMNCYDKTGDCYYNRDIKAPF